MPGWLPGWTQGERAAELADGVSRKKGRSRAAAFPRFIVKRRCSQLESPRACKARPSVSSALGTPRWGRAESRLGIAIFMLLYIK